MFLPLPFASVLLLVAQHNHYPWLNSSETVPGPVERISPIDTQPQSESQIHIISICFQRFPDGVNKRCQTADAVAKTAS